MKSLFIEFLCLIARFNSCYLPFQAYWRGQRIIQWWFTVLRSEEIILHYQLYMMTMHADHLDETIVLKLDLFKIWVSSFDWVTRFWPSWPGYFFFKSKRRRFSKKTKKNKNQRVCNQVLTGSCRVNPSDHTGFFLSLFFLQLCPVPAPGRPDPGSTCQTGSDFKTIDETILASKIYFFFLFILSAMN
jgi:hypothetical protein